MANFFLMTAKYGWLRNVKIKKVMTEGEKMFWNDMQQQRNPFGNGHSFGWLLFWSYWSAVSRSVGKQGPPYLTMKRCLNQSLSRNQNPSNWQQKRKKVAKKYALSPQATAHAHTAKVTAIGDSVMVDITPELKQVFPHALINGAVGRQFYDLPTIAQSLKLKVNSPTTWWSTWAPTDHQKRRIFRGF